MTLAVVSVTVFSYEQVIFRSQRGVGGAHGHAGHPSVTAGKLMVAQMGWNSSVLQVWILLLLSAVHKDPKIIDDLF